MVCVLQDSGAHTTLAPGRETPSGALCQGGHLLPGSKRPGGTLVTSGCQGLLPALPAASTRPWEKQHGPEPAELLPPSSLQQSSPLPAEAMSPGRGRGLAQSPLQPH